MIVKFSFFCLWSMNTFGSKVTSNDHAFPCLEVGQIFNLGNEKKEYYVKLHLRKEIQHKHSIW
jgi:hypothetical protein